MGWGWSACGEELEKREGRRNARGVWVRERFGVVAEGRRGGERRSPWGSAQWKRLQDSDSVRTESFQEQRRRARAKLARTLVAPRAWRHRSLSPNPMSTRDCTLVSLTSAMSKEWSG